MAIGGGKNMGGLLGSDFNDPRTQGVLGLASGLLAGGGPSVGRPISLGQALGSGLQMGQTAFNQAQTRQDRMARLKADQEYRERQEARQKRLDELAEKKGQFQVVGGNLFDMSGDKPTLVELPKTMTEKASPDFKYIQTTNPDGSVTIRQSNVFDAIEAAEAAKKNNKTTALSTKAQTAEDEDFYAIDTSQGILSDIDYYTDLIDDDKLSFGFVEGIGDSTARLLGIAGEEEINSAQFDTFLEKLRNDTLRLNKGVQTEGDAKRALNEIIQNKNDTEVVRAQLKKLREYNERAVELRKRNINRRRKSQNVGAFDFSGYTTPTTESDVGFKIK